MNGNFPSPATLCVFVYRNLSLPTLSSLFAMKASVIGYHIVFQFGDALICRARNIAATQWLHHSTDDVLVMSDDDFQFDAPSMDALVSLAREKQCIVSGVTPLKSGEYTAIVPEGDPLAPEVWRDPASAPMKIKYAGGLIAYPRSVLEKLAATLPLLHQDSSIESFYPFFMPMIVGNEYLSEDYACHQRARELGIEVWVEPKCQVGHLAADMVVTLGNMDQIRELYA